MGYAKSRSRLDIRSQRNASIFNSDVGDKFRRLCPDMQGNTIRLMKIAERLKLTQQIPVDLTDHAERIAAAWRLVKAHPKALEWYQKAVNNRDID